MSKALGQRATLVLARASTEVPKELLDLVDAFPEARARWERLTEAQRRMLREAVLEPKSAAARDRRLRTVIVVLLGLAVLFFILARR